MLPKLKKKMNRHYNSVFKRQTLESDLLDQYPGSVTYQLCDTLVIYHSVPLFPHLYSVDNNTRDNNSTHLTMLMKD